MITCALLVGAAMIANSPFEDGFCDVKWELVKGSAEEFDTNERQDNQYRIPGVAMSDDGLVVTVYDCRYMSDRDLGWNHSANRCTLRGWDKSGVAVPCVSNGWEPIDIAGNESLDRGKTWSKPAVIIDVPNSSDYNKDGAPTPEWTAAKTKEAFDFGDPCVLFDPGDETHPAKFWCMGLTGGGLRSAGAGNDCVLYSRLAKPGEKWGNRTSIKAEVLKLIGESGGTVFQGPGQGLYLKHSKTLPKGTIVFPMQYFGRFIKAFAIYSTDHGESWQATGFCEEGGSQENQITEMPDGSWLMMVKSAGGGPRRFYRTTDYVNWTSYSDNAPASLAVEGSVIYIGYNPTIGKHVYATCYSRENRFERRKLTLTFGVDTGDKIEWNWNTKVYPEIMIHEASTNGKSYNSLVMLDKNTLGILYEACNHIYFERVDVNRYLGNVGRAFEMKAWKGETVTALVPDFCEMGPAPKGISLRVGHLETVKYAPYPNSMERREAYDRVDWGSAGRGEPRVVEVKVPRDAKAGVYECGMMRVRVIDRVLPEPKDWKYYLDLWQHPWAIARVARVKPFSKEHYAAMKPVYELLASAGQKTITVPILDMPWDHQCRDAYHSLTEDEDFKRFDEYVEFCLKCGLGPDISCYSLCPWKLSVQPGTSEFEAYWAPFMTRFAAHLKAKGWFEHTYMAMDERAPAQVRAIVDFVGKYAPGLKISMAGDRNPADFDGINIDSYSQVLQHVDERFLSECASRRAKGLKTTIYTCMNPWRPNTFVGSNVYESFWLGASPAALGLDGYLRWAFCSWPEDPIKDASYGNWTSGDTFLCYPGAQPSIRFLELRNGITAAEKVWNLREEGALSADDEARLKRCFDVQKALNGEYYQQSIKETVNDIVNR